MIKWVVASAGLVIAVVYLLFLIGDSSPTPTSSGDSEPTSAQRDNGSMTGSRTRPAPLPASPEAFPGEDDLGVEDDPPQPSERPGAELDARLDREYPARYYAAIAKRCDPAGFDPDASVHLQYQLRILRGEVLATNVRVVESSVGNAEFEQCLVAALEQSRWRDDEMPDLDEEHDFYYRVKSQKKYMSDDEQEDFDRKLGTKQPVEEDD